MANFKFVISDPQNRKSHQLEVDQTKAIGLVGKKIGEEFTGDIIGLSGYSLQITGGTDKDGFPMHPQVHGQVRKKILLSNPPGFHPLKKGERRRKMVRGDTISADIVQINVKIMKKGSVSLDEVAPLKKKEKKEEKKTEEKPKEEKAEKKEEKKEEKKQEKVEVKSEMKSEVKIEVKAAEGGGGESKKE
jgi:small subunit ribosomal protein S6e